MTMFGMFKPEEEQSDTRKNVTQAILFGGGLAGSGAVVLSAFELIKGNPEKGFTLLEKWGPWFFLALFAVWAINGLLNRFLDVFSKLGGRFAGSLDRVADEQVKLASAARDQADAMQRTADRDDRDHERMATLVDYAGQKSREAADAVSALQPMLVKMAAQVETLMQKKEG